MDIFTQKAHLENKPAGALKSMTWVLLLAGFLLLPLFGKAQLTVTDNVTAQQMVQRLIGDNVAILNPTLNCKSKSGATFKAVSSNLGLSGGIILSTMYSKSDGAGVVGVNGPAALEMSGNPPPGSVNLSDPDLDAINGPNSVNDACALEFDFVPDVDTTSTLRFKYVFGSEEYPEYACSAFNDVFGFFLTGGPYANTNIALIPSTALPVVINAINMGPGTNGSPNNCIPPGSTAPYSMYYVDNLGTGGTSVTLDGFTTVLEAQAVVQPCDTYHIKLAVGNTSDRALQSAVFLQENSFSVDTVTLKLDGIIASDKGYLVEGCTPAEIKATRTQATSRKKKICLSYGGTATNGVDYPLLPDSIIIPPYQTEGSVLLNPLQDFILEPGYETIIIRRLNCCTQTVIDSVEIKIRDSLKVDLLSVDTAVCAGSAVRLQVSADPAFVLNWRPTTNVQNPTDSYTVAHPMETTTYTVNAAFKSCPEVERSFTVLVEPMPQVTIMPGDSVICLRDSMQFRVNVEPTNFSPYNYFWAPPLYISDPYVQNPKFYNIDFRDHMLVLTVQTPLGCIGSDSAYLHTRPPMDLYDITGDQIIKYGSSVQLNASGADYYLWLPPSTLDNANLPNPLATPTEPTIYTVMGWNRYGCKDSGQVKIDIDYTMSEFLPNAFSPNGDGLNDVFHINKTWRFQKLLEFRIFDRWGQQVYNSINVNEGWNGKYQGEDQPLGVYHYVIRVMRPDGQIKTYKGDVTLVR